MPRYTNTITTRIGAAQARAMVSDYLSKQGFVFTVNLTETWWQKGSGIATIPQFMKFEPTDGMVQLEAWVSSIALVPGVYGGEQGLDGVWGFAIKSALKKRVNALEKLLAGAQPDPAFDGVVDVPPAGAATTPATPAEWHDDPTGRHQKRYWDGTRWTEHVADDGVASTDPV